jgi:hypothetical protein
MNLWIMIEFDPLYKIVSESVAQFLTENVKKIFFPLKIVFRLYFAGVSLLGSIILLAVVIRESIPNTGRWTL